MAGRRASKLVSLVTSCFSATYVFLWKECFPQTELTCIPCFDGRAVAYPSDLVLLDYLSWRQSDTHVNNQVPTSPAACPPSPASCAAMDRCFLARKPLLVKERCKFLLAAGGHLSQMLLVNDTPVPSVKM